MGETQCVEVPQGFYWNLFFLKTHLLGEQLRRSSYTFLSRQGYFPHPSQKSSEQRKEMTFDRRLANVTDPVLAFRGLYCPRLKIWWNFWGLYCPFSENV